MFIEEPEPWNLFLSRTLVGLPGGPGGVRSKCMAYTCWSSLAKEPLVYSYDFLTALCNLWANEAFFSSDLLKLRETFGRELILLL